MSVLFGSLTGYKPAWLRADIIAGLTVWAVLVPGAVGRSDVGTSREEMTP